jgi:hypothetical protein
MRISRGWRVGKRVEVCSVWLKDLLLLKDMGAPFARRARASVGAEGRDVRVHVVPSRCALGGHCASGRRRLQLLGKVLPDPANAVQESRPHTRRICYRCVRHEVLQCGGLMPVSPYPQRDRLSI